MKRKNIFRCLSVFLCSTLLFSAFACGKKPEESGGNEGNGGAFSTEIKDTSILLASNGVSPYKIVIANDAAPVIETGANEIATYLRLSTGATIAVTSDEAQSGLTNGDYVISVGDTYMSRAANVSVSAAEVTRDGYAIKRMENAVYIVGASDKATAYGCLEFLEKQIGYETYTAKEIAYDTHDTLYLKDFDLVDIPSFESRNMDGMAQLDQETSFRLRVGLMFGGGSDRFDNDNKKYYIPDADHNTDTIISPDKNPEYAKFISGGSTQICFTQGNGLEEAYITELIKSIQENEDGYLVNVSQEDGKNFCQCGSCQAEIRLYGISGLWIRFLNKIITGIEAWRTENCPERYLEYTTYAYGDSLAPPVDVLPDGSYRVKDDSCIPHEKLNIRVTMASCSVHALDDEDCPENATKWITMQGWRAVTDKFHIWDYAAVYNNYLPFYDDIGSLKRNKQIYAEMGVTDLFTEYNSGGSFTQFGYLRMYLHAKTMWNVNEDIDALTDNFFKHYYKDVATEMRAVYDLLRTHNAVWKFDVSPTTRWTVSHFPRRLIEQIETYLNKADEKIDAIDDLQKAETLRERVDEERACINFLKLYFYDAYAYAQEDFSALYTVFEQQMLQMNMPSYSERESMESWLESIKKN